MQALIIGISGQDGALLAKLLLEQGYDVIGASRDIEVRSFERLKRLGVLDRVKLVSLNLSDLAGVMTAIKELRPSEVYNLSGQSSVGLSYQQPVETLTSNTLAVLNLLEALKLVDPSIKFYNAGSSESFGNTSTKGADETTLFNPKSPYGVSKASAHNLVRTYREAYGLRASSGILFNHESVLRPDRFVTKKITIAAARIKHGKQNTLELGNLDIVRDWGWAPEFVDAISRILSLETSDDFVIGTGRSASLSDFVRYSFDYFDLDWKNYVEINDAFIRPSEISSSYCNPKKAREILGWVATTDVEGVVENMCNDAAIITSSHSN